MVRQQIEKFIREQDCLDEVVGVLPDKITMIETGENQVRFWKGAAGHPLKVSVNLVELITNLYSDVIDENGTLDIENAFISQSYDEYLDACAELVKIELE